VRPISVKLSRILAIALVSACLGCSAPVAHKPVVLTYLDVEWDTPDVMPGLAQDLQDFTQETGIQVRRLPRPDGSLNQLALWRELLQRGDSAPDVLSIDVIWSGMLSQYLMDLKPHFEDELSKQNSFVLENYTVDGKVVALPHHAYAGLLFYRPDLLRKYGYRSPPKTWEQLEAMAARIQSGERVAGNKDFWGYVWQGATDEDLTCSGLEWQVSNAGGRIIEKDKRISVNNPRTIKAWERAAHWVSSISPPAVTAYSKWDAQNMWASGNAAFVRSWMSDSGIIRNGWPFSRSPRVSISEFGLTNMPGGTVGQFGTLGGNGVAVSAKTTHPQEALRFLQFLARRDAEKLRESQSVAAPSGLEFYELPPIITVYPELTKSRERRGGLVARPSVAAGADYESVTRAYIRELHSVLTREKSAPVAAADLERELIQITGFQVGPPSK
jgi:trehalose/maltose transport system substrate-binding protein